jgi:lysophospholipid acyltransferase (LPLAT)-like uncharacterized protein
MTAAKELKYFLINSLLSSLIFFLLALYARTLRVQFEGAQKIQKHLENGGRVIFASWHQRLFGGFFVPQLFQWSPCIMISQSKDGDFISNIVRHSGWIPVRGSSSRGGAKALRAMVQKVAENHIGVHIVDGPNGPPRIIKPGLISLARNTDAVICPGIISYGNAWTFNSWDHFMIPKPFSRVRVRFGSIFILPKTISDDQFESLRKDVEDYMIKEYDTADKSWRK